MGSLTYIILLLVAVIIITIISVILFVRSRKTSLTYILKLHILFVITAAIISGTVNILYYFILNSGKYKLIPISFLPVILIYFWFAYKTNGFLVDMLPNSWQTVVDSISEPLVIMNVHDEIIDYNEAFLENFSKYIDITEENDFYKLIKTLMNDCDENQQSMEALERLIIQDNIGVHCEISSNEKEISSYYIRKQSITNKKDVEVGKIVMFFTGESFEKSNSKDIDLELVINKEYKLTKRESEIAVCILSGDTNRAVAEKLSISENTVKYHVKNILRKTGSNNRYDFITTVSKLALQRDTVQ